MIGTTKLIKPQPSVAVLTAMVFGAALSACALDPVDVATAPIERLKKKVVTKEVNPHIAQRMAEAKDTKDSSTGYPDITDVPLERPTRLTGTQRRLLKTTLRADGSSLRLAIADDTARMVGMAQLEASIVANIQRFDRQYEYRVEADAKKLLQAIKADRLNAAKATAEAAAAEAAAKVKMAPTSPAVDFSPNQ